MISLLITLQDKHEDALLWKARKLWGGAKNPDAIVDAVAGISNMLLCIPEPMKRDRSIAYITNDINERVKAVDAAVKQKAKDRVDLEKLQERLQKKKRPEEAELKQLEELPEVMAAVGQQLAEMKLSVLPQIDGKELASCIKQIMDKQAREANRKKLAAQVESNNITLETLGLWSDFNGDVEAAHEYGVSVYRGRYHTKVKNDWVEISNFVMKIIYHLQTGGDTAYRLISIKNTEGVEKVISINTDDFVSVGPFKKVLARQGHFVFKGGDADLSRLHELLQKDEVSSTHVRELGYNSRGKFYAWANGLLDTASETPGVCFYQTDEYGIVKLRDHHYFLPAMSKMFADKDELYENEKRFVYLRNERVNFNTWSQLHIKVYKQKAIIGQLWAVTAIYRDIIYGMNNIRVSPILNLSGQRGSGKTQFAESIMALFGHPQPAIPLGSQSTAKGFMRKFAQFKNAVVYLEEYKNNVKKDFIEALKNVYDGTSYTRAQKSNDFQTDSLPVSSACLLGGQEMPTIEPALFSRVIMLSFEPGKFNEQERKLFKDLKRIELDGLSCITGEVLQHRQHFQKHFSETFEAAKKQLFTQVNNAAMDDRFVVNIAILHAVRTVFNGLIDFPFTIEEAAEVLVSNLHEQFGVMQGNDDLGKWWQLMEQLVAQNILRAGRDFRFDGGTLWLRLNNAYGHYVKELNLRRDANCIAKPSLESYMKNDRDTFVAYEKVKIDTKSQQSYWSFGFNYLVLQDRYQINLSVPDGHHHTSFDMPTTLNSIAPKEGGWSETEEIF